MGLAGSSITVSCMTNVIAFAVGTYTSLEALLSFSIYASVGVLLVFLYQVGASACLAQNSRTKGRACPRAVPDLSAWGGNIWHSAPGRRLGTAPLALLRHVCTTPGVSAPGACAAKHTVARDNQQG